MKVLLIVVVSLGLVCGFGAAKMAEDLAMKECVNQTPLAICENLLKD